MFDAIGDILCQEPYAYLPAAKRTLWRFGTVPTAVAAAINNPIVDLTGSPTGSNLTLATGITPFDVPGVMRKTLLCLKAQPMTITDALAYAGLEIFDFPQGRIGIYGVQYSLRMTTTSALASTLNASSTVSVALGTATASNLTLTSTMVDLAPATNHTSSATINVAPATVSAALAATAEFDGTVTAKKMFLNAAVTTNTDIDADATVVWDGFIEITWAHLGLARLVNGA